MRYINTSNVLVPVNWVIQAKALLGQNHTSLWAYFKKDLENIVNKKCWFSESINLGADNDVEHFRPKGQNIRELKVKNADLEQAVWAQIDAASRPGYSYLGLEFTNYRYACTFVNSVRQGNSGKYRGKSNFFPLQVNSPYANSLATISTEVHCLLDPCNPSDPRLLTFNEFGNVDPHISIANGSWEYCRVKVSVEIYHLEYYLFRDQRIITWNGCKEHIELINDLYTKGTGLAESAEHLKYHIKMLNEKVKKTSGFSAVAIDCIKSYKKKFAWLDTVFPDNTLVK